MRINTLTYADLETAATGAPYSGSTGPVRLTSGYALRPGTPPNNYDVCEGSFVGPTLPWNYRVEASADAQYSYYHAVQESTSSLGLRHGKVLTTWDFYSRPVNSGVTAINCAAPSRSPSFTIEQEGFAARVDRSQHTGRHDVCVNMTYVYNVQREVNGTVTHQTWPLSCGSGQPGDVVSRGKQRFTVNFDHSVSYRTGSVSAPVLVETQDLEPTVPQSARSLPPRATPYTTALSGLTPNPAGSDGTIRYEIAEAGEISVAVYDLLGREVLHVFEGAVEPGAHAVSVELRALPPGVYAVRLEAGASLHTKTFTVVR